MAVKRFDVRDIDLDVLNSLTQYPSIPTYHQIDHSNGMLKDGWGNCILFADKVVGTEKVDGVNARIITLPGNTYIIGSRTELLYAKGDVVANAKDGIVETLRPFADDIALTFDAITVYYLEVYGAVGQYAKEYGGSKTASYRMFDAQIIDLFRLYEWNREQAAAWRQHGRQAWLNEGDLAKAAELIDVDLTPRLFTIDASELPVDIDKMYTFLGEHLPRTRVAIDDGAGGKAEGIVLRAPDRNVIAKARFQDYERTMQRRGGK